MKTEYVVRNELLAMNPDMIARTQDDDYKK